MSFPRVGRCIDLPGLGFSGDLLFFKVFFFFFLGGGGRLCFKKTSNMRFCGKECDIRVNDDEMPQMIVIFLEDQHQQLPICTFCVLEKFLGN